MRVPAFDPEKERQIVHLKKRLAGLERLPPNRREDECADAIEAGIRDMLWDLEPRAPYSWTTSPDEIADDAIIVGIGGTDAEMIALGLSYVEPTASIYWPARVTALGVFAADGEMGPWSVPAALRRAQELKETMGYERVVVTLAEAGLWRPEFGTLAEREGLQCAVDSQTS